MSLLDSSSSGMTYSSSGVDDLSSSSSSSSSSSGGNYSSSSTGSIDPLPFFGTGTPSGFVAYGVICFILVVVFTAGLVVYYSRPKVPPMVAILTFLAWSATPHHQHAASKLTNTATQKELFRVLEVALICIDTYCSLSLLFRATLGSARLLSVFSFRLI